jgi:predicted RNA-binding protein with PIN domain
MRQWVVDGMNVIGSRSDRWWNDPERAMVRLTLALDRYAVTTGELVTVVFDRDPGKLPELGHLDVMVAGRKGRNAADHEIVRIVAEKDDPSSLRVVTSDKRLRERVVALGAQVTSSGAFRDHIDEVIGRS